MGPILWHSISNKKLGTVETSSVLGSEELIAMKTTTEAAGRLRYKIHMMGIEVNEPKKSIVKTWR
jgi:hypothetical protein